MATEILNPTSIVSKAGVQGTDVDNLTSMGADDTNYVLATNNNTSIDVRVGFDSPSGDLTSLATQSITAIVRPFDSGQSGSSTVTIEVWETGGGAAIASTGPTTLNPLDGDTQLTATFNTTDTTDDTGASVEFRIIGTKSGGSPATRNTVNIDFVKWDVTYTEAGGFQAAWAYRNNQIL